MFQRTSQLETPSAVPTQGPLVFPVQGLCDPALEGIELLSVNQTYNLGVIFDSTPFFDLFILMYMNFVSFSSLKSLLISAHITDTLFQVFVISYPAYDSFFPTPDLTCQKGPLKHYSCTYLPGLFLWLLFVLTSLVYIHRFPCLCKPSSPLRVQSDNFFGSCAGLRQSLLPAIHSCLFDMPASLLARLFCSAVW